MAISTYSVKLWYRHVVGGTAFEYVKIADIKTVPDLGQAAPGLETTTTSDGARTYIKSIRETPAVLEFTANYALSDSTDEPENPMALLFETYDRILDLADGQEREYVVTFQHNDTLRGTDGEYVFKGYLDVYVNGGGVNEVVNMTIAITPSTPVMFYPYELLTVVRHGTSGSYALQQYNFDDYGLSDVNIDDVISLYFEYIVDGGPQASTDYIYAGINTDATHPGTRLVDLHTTPSGFARYSFTLTSGQWASATRNMDITVRGSAGLRVRISNVQITKVVPNDGNGGVTEEPEEDTDIPVETAG